MFSLGSFPEYGYSETKAGGTKNFVRLSFDMCGIYSSYMERKTVLQRICVHKKFMTSKVFKNKAKVYAWFGLGNLRNVPSIHSRAQSYVVE